MDSNKSFADIAKKAPENGTGLDHRGGKDVLQGSDIITGIPDVPATVERPIRRANGVQEPGISRATRAASDLHPKGSEGYSPDNRTVLQQHVDFFDRDNDGVITMSDTYSGFRRMGFNVLISLLAIPVIHPPFAFATCKTWFPPIDPFLRIYTENIHKGKHGSDSGVFDHEGRFSPQKFEEIFSKWDEGNKGGLSFHDVINMTQNHWDSFDFFGWSAAKFEWIITYLLAVDENGLLSKEAVRGVFDGSIFFYMEEKYKQKGTEQQMRDGQNSFMQTMKEILPKSVNNQAERVQSMMKEE